MLTKAEMIEMHGTPPPSLKGDGPQRWTIHTGSRSVQYESTDRGETWNLIGVTWPAERARRDNEALEQARIQRELK